MVSSKEQLGYIRTWANNASLESRLTKPTGGKEKNKHKNKKLNAGRGTVGKTAVVGIKERDSKKIKSFKVPSHFTRLSTVAFRLVQLFTPMTHWHTKASNDTDESVTFGRVEVKINGTESFWSCLKRGYYGVYHARTCRNMLISVRMSGSWIQ